MSAAASPIAIIGIGCMFPGSRNSREFWNTILQGRDCITEVPPTHWSKTDYFDPNPKAPDRVYCTRGGYLPETDFDPAAFGIPPASLEATDTSQLLGLVVARMALQDAGYLERSFDRDRTAVILGVTGTQELVIPLASRLGHPHWRRALCESGVDPETADAVIERIGSAYASWQESSFPGLLGNVVAGRIANRLDLRGPNCVVDAACASSLAALNLALQELESHRSDMVLTGGVDTLNDIFMHACFSQSGLLSRTGDIRPFSADADGTLLGEGVGMVVLKRLPDAERDGDRIYAVIRGLGASSDGKSQSIYAPRVEGQVQALRKAYSVSGIDPATVGLIEAHGTGTRVGDRVEFEALRTVFSRSDENDFPKRHALGSVKSQIGHTKAAAGVAGLIKAALSLHHKVLPPTIKAEKPDPDLNIDKTPFFLNTQPRPWKRRGDDPPRRAAVSSFGFGGSNFHVVLEEAGQQPNDILWDDDIQILAFSAPDRSGLIDRMDRWIAKALTKDAPLALLAAESRQAFHPEDRFRLLAVVRQATGATSAHAWIDELQSCREAILQASAGAPPVFSGNVYFGCNPVAPKIGLLFPGQGSQKPAMGRDWFVRFPEALSLLEAMGSATSDPEAFFEGIDPGPVSDSRRVRQLLASTQNAQPAIGAVSIGMWSVLRFFGVRADVLCGHSYGELCALHAAGRIGEDAFLRLSIARGNAMADAARQCPGGMLAVMAESAVAMDICQTIGALVLANRNTPRQQVLSGPTEAIERAKNWCDARGIRAIRLDVSAAFHSPAMQPAAGRFWQALQQETIHPGNAVVLSNADGKPFPEDAPGVRRRLADQIDSPVDFVSCVHAMVGQGVKMFLEAGPKAVLSGLVRETLAGAPDVAILSLDQGSGSALFDLAHVLCPLAAAGHPVAIDRWNPCIPHETQQRPAFHVQLCGANYRNSGKRPVPADGGQAPVGRSAESDTAPESVSEAPSFLMTENPMHPKPVSTEHTDSHSLMQTLQQGIRSIEAIQHQTTEAHKAFLHAQAEAARLVQQVLAGAGGFASAVPMPQRDASSEPSLPADGLKTPMAKREPTAFSGQQHAGPPALTADADAGNPAAPSAMHEPTAQGADARKSAGAGTSCASCAASGEEISTPPKTSSVASVLLDVVSRLTGYPVDVLGLDMDIEADLGIDSIKRVEILSAMEEAVPGLAVPAPDEMAGLKTLRQIADRLDATPAVTDQIATFIQREEERGEGEESVGEHLSADSDRIVTVLLETVSSLTGYPVEVLGLDMDIEADLGIDSIKRVEILAAVEEALPGLVMPSPDVSAALRTLRQIAAVLSQSGASADIGSPAPMAQQAEHSETKEDSTSEMTVPRLPLRRIVQLRHLPVPAENPAWSAVSDGLVLVCGMYPELQQKIADRLSARFRLTAVSCSLEDALQRPVNETLRGLLVLAQAPGSTDGELFSETDEGFLLKSLAVCARHAASLQQAGQTGPAVFAGISFLDGGFGFWGRPVSHPLSGGLGGLVKTARIEWPGVFCRSVDVDPAWTDTASLAQCLVDVLMADWEPSVVEMGVSPELSPETVLEPVLEAVPYLQENRDSWIQPSDTILISGGGRGIAASIAIALARAGSPRLVLLGRSKEPVAEPPWLAQVTELSRMRALIGQQPEYAGKNPKEIDRIARGWLANRQIAQTLDAIRQAGAQAIYRSVDVTDRDALSRVIREVEATWGPVTGLVHAAGVLADRLIAQKTAKEAQSVFAPKISGLRYLLDALSGERLRWVALFSSVAGRMGNRGQADYAMANEAMNKIAHALALRHPGLRVVSLNWGPWNGGMVDGSLKNLFAKNGIPLIDREAGAAAFLAEISSGKDVEVVIGEDMREPALQPAEGSDAVDSLRLSIRKEIDIERYPVLNSHLDAGIPVLPFSLATEWMGYGALHENPGLLLSGLDDIRLLKGIRLQHQPMTVRLMTGKPVKQDDAFILDVEIRDGMREGKDVVHTRGKAVLRAGFDAPPAFDPEPLIQALEAYARGPEEMYQTILAHGKDLRGIRRIIGISGTAMAAELISAPHPEAWMSDPIRRRWLADPLVLDGAFQMAAIWCHEHLGVVCQPVFAKRYRQYRGQFPKEGVTGILEVRERGPNRMVGDITFLDGDRRVVARFEGFAASADSDEPVSI
ncbi:type I polyketide synthase [Desulfatirhabdium butyrativorans]|uniref:type I polyketide synthase n=1 Tax=Desulfatirhabdium butyrativorans TaxID=340467 RepID=UPI0006882B79|nr:type I polyketide synthase [Desulfatirhabdium butyrativorans]